MARYVLCDVGEIENGSVRRFQPDSSGPAVAVARCDDGFHAVIDNCSHEDYPLSEGEVFPDLCEIECVRHGSTFSLIDGTPQSLPATKPVRVVEAGVENGAVWVDMP